MILGLGLLRGSCCCLLAFLPESPLRSAYINIPYLPHQYLILVSWIAHGIGTIASPCDVSHHNVSVSLPKDR
jgi:hypothetical protein